MAQELVCSASAAGTPSGQEGDAGAERLVAQIHCALCLPLSEALPAPQGPDLAAPSLRYALRAPLPAQLVSAEALTPLSRGPPSLA